MFVVNGLELSEVLYEVQTTRAVLTAELKDTFNLTIRSNEQFKTSNLFVTR